jgi:hypothetical protein
VESSSTRTPRADISVLEKHFLDIRTLPPHAVDLCVGNDGGAALVAYVSGVKIFQARQVEVSKKTAASKFL